MSFVRRLRGRKIFLPPAVQNRLSPEEATTLSNDSSLASAESAPLGNFVVLAGRKQTEGRIINGWLILTAFVGAAIALADGLTRAPNPGLELAPPQPLEYEPYRAAFLFAGIVLPLLFAYAQKARLSFAETLFLWFVFCTAAYTKDFSYLRWPGAPLFVTDVVLVVLLLLIYTSPQRHCPPRPLILNLSLTFFVAAGVLATTRGFLGHRESILVLRDFALIAYSFFLLVGYDLLDNWLAIKRAAVWFVLGTALSVLNGLGWLTVAPEQRRFVAPGIYVVISLVGVLVMIANGLIRSLVGWILVAIFCIGLWLANARSLFACLVAMCLAAMGVPGMLRQKHASLIISSLAFSAALLCLFIFVFSHSSPGSDFTNRVKDNMSSGLLHTSDDPYWQFRLTAWREAWRRFQEYPAAGEGFGRPFNFEIWDNDPRPHNTFLTVLYKMGLLGLLPLLAFLASFFWSALRTARHNSKSHHVPFLHILILEQVSFCVWGGADAVLESPYVASLFWVGTGLGLRVVEKLNSEQVRRRLARLRGGCEQLS